MLPYDDDPLVVAGCAQALQWIAEFAREDRFLCVDPERVRAAYAALLQSQHTGWSRSAVELVFLDQWCEAQRAICEVIGEPYA